MQVYILKKTVFDTIYTPSGSLYFILSAFVFIKDEMILIYLGYYDIYYLH